MCSSPHLWFLHAKQRILKPEFQSLWVPALICSFCMPNSEFWARITSLYGSQTSLVLLCMQNSFICTRISSLYGFQPSSVVMSTHNSVLNTRINRLYWFQLSPVFLCMQISVISTRITRLYGSQPSCVVFAFKPATFGPKLHVSRQTSTVILCMLNSVPGIRITSL